MEKTYTDSIGAIYTETRKTLIKLPQDHIGEYIVPEGVIYLEEHSFEGCASLTKVTLPNGLQCIGPCAFWGNNSLSEINIPDSVEFIGSNAFSWCTNLESLVIPKSVIQINVAAFQGCDNIKSVRVDSPHFVLEDGILYDKAKTSVMFAFRNLCNHHVMIPKTVTHILESAFYGNTTVMSVTIPQSVTEIGFSTFDECCNLKEIYLPFCKVSKILSCGYYILEKLRPPHSEKATIEWHGDGYESNKDKLRWINDEDLEQRLAWFIDAEGAKYSADKKIFRRIPSKSCRVYRILDGVEEISISMTFGGKKIDTFILPNSVRKLSRRSFRNFKNLRKINIPKNVDTIEDNALTNCQNLKEIDLQSPHFILEEGILYNKDKTKIISTFPALIKERVVLPLSLKIIACYAFQDHSKLKSITIPNPDATIEPGALCGCSNLIEIKVANPAYTIENGMLYYNSIGHRKLLVALNGLIGKHITIDESVSDIYSQAFCGCVELNTVNILSANTSFDLLTFNKFSIGDDSKLEAIYIPNSLNHINHIFGESTCDDETPYRPKTNILYIHGLKRENSSEESRTATILREALDTKQYCVIAPTFSPNGVAAVKKMRKLISKHQIEIIIGSSLGGFITLCCKEIERIFINQSITRIVINPCIRPDIEMPKRNNKGIANSYSTLLNLIWEDITPEKQERTIGIFSNNDELFSYREEFLQHYQNVVDIEDGHRISEENVRDVVAKLVENLNEI